MSEQPTYLWLVKIELPKEMLMHSVTPNSNRDEALTPNGISMTEMPVRPTLDIMSTGHNINGTGLLTPLGVGTIETGVAKLAMCWCGCSVCRGKGYNFVGRMLSHGPSISLL